MFVEIKETETLKALDRFLRDIWVECCGHLSEFDINGVIYDCYPEDTYGSGDCVKNVPGITSMMRKSKFVWNCMRMV